ncbi:DDE-type integrase/transposase/recombinase [Streptomyces antibioticus]|uniref:DDE-type integrase/transposase/recombinase n=1 Tax=Streptomyces antibioticus TaxID=1890 RepID=UPI003409A08F
MSELYRFIHVEKANYPITLLCRVLHVARSEKTPAPDRIGGDVHTERPGTRWVGDITYLPTPECWLCLACRLDLATREIVGYALADHHRAELVVDALDMAHGRTGVQPGCVIHSGRGSEYTSTQFQGE